MSIILNSYWPLCINGRGRKAIEKYDFLPYIDSSNRREPSFEQEFPGISATCRASKLIPRLKVGDTVVYITHQGKYNKEVKQGHWMLVAILEVIHRFENHQEAANWYQSNGYEIPSNCVIGENHIPQEMTGMPEWEAEKALKAYKERIAKHPAYFVCRAKYKELRNPLMITRDDMQAIFNRIPCTQTPPYITEEELRKLEDLI